MEYICNQNKGYWSGSPFFVDSNRFALQSRKVRLVGCLLQLHMLARWPFVLFLHTLISFMSRLITDKCNKSMVLHGFWWTKWASFLEATNAASVCLSVMLLFLGCSFQKDSAEVTLSSHHSKLRGCLSVSTVCWLPPTASKVCAHACASACVNASLAAR